MKDEMITMDVVRILGIESSCDETAAAVVEAKIADRSYRPLDWCDEDTELKNVFGSKNLELPKILSKRILSNVIYSQISEHKQFNGVVPEIAARSHLEKIDMVVRKALNDAGINDRMGINKENLDAIAGTCGPGLIGGVIVGATFAKGISVASGIPFIAINHIEAHALTVRLTDDNVEFPYLLLLASGGHCQICLVHSCDDFEVIGRTLDDSIGESFDKVAKMLGLGYPGGPALEKCAANGNEESFDFPKPLCHKGCLDLSFSGLKTAVRTVIEKRKTKDDDFEKDSRFKADVSSSFQRTVANILEYKMAAAIAYCSSKSVKLSAVVMAGGVAANRYVRNRLKAICSAHNLRFSVPPIPLCTDNAAMIAWMGVEKFIKHKFAKSDFRPRPVWALGE